VYIYVYIHKCIHIYTYIYMHTYIYIYVNIHKHMCIHVCKYAGFERPWGEHDARGVCIHVHTGWRRLIGSPNLQIIFLKRSIKYKSLLRKMTYKDKGSYESSPPCICIDVCQYTGTKRGDMMHLEFVYIHICVFMCVFMYSCVYLCIHVCICFFLGTK